MSEKQTISEKNSSRRSAIKKIGTAGLVGGVWSMPVVQSVMVPVHAQTSTDLSGTFSLNAAQEVGNPSTSSATGTATWSVSGSQLSITVTHTEAGATAAHIHEGAAGANGPVVFPFSSVASPMSLSVSLTAAQLTTLKANGFYVNIHSAANAPGAIRGQLTV